jgi:hypothetical protein
MESAGRHLPWARPRHELLLLALVAVVSLSPWYGTNAQDVSRLCLASALQRGNLSNDDCLRDELDKAYYGGHYYSDKAPALSVLELPIANAVRLPPVQHIWKPDRGLWAVRILSSGLAFLVFVFLVGRVCEGIAAGTGAAAAISLGLGTFASSLAAANFGHIPAATLALGAFLLAWSRRPLAAGLAAGALPLVEYQAGAVLLILLAYVAARGVRPAAVYAAGAVPGIALLLAYDQLAFGAPWHLSYRYVANGYALAQERGFFGVAAPKLFSAYEVFSGREGLLVTSPIVGAGIVGLLLLARRYLHEALVCAAVTLFFVLLNCGYFLPYGGFSPGPRFLVPALPFLALGFAPAFARFPRSTAALAAVSVVGSTALLFVWASGPAGRTIWGELAPVLAGRHRTRFVDSIHDNALVWLGLDKYAATLVVAAAAVAALALAIAPLTARRAPRCPRLLALATAASLGLVAAAGASAIAKYPYGDHEVVVPAPISASISTTRPVSVPGDEVDFFVNVENELPEIVRGVGLTVRLPPGLRLLGLPYYERGSGCTGSSTITCNLDYLLGRMETPVRFGVRVLANGGARRTVEVWGTLNGGVGRKASITIAAGSS